MANKKRKRYSSYSRRKKELNVLHFLPLLFIVAIVPLIMRGTVVDLSELEQSVWLGQESRFDIFSFHKSIWFVIGTFLAFTVLLWGHLEGYLKIRKSWTYLGLGVYGLFVLLSWIGALDVGVAARGFIELFQGGFVLVAYGAIVFITMNMVSKETHVRYFVYALLFVGTVTFIIGFTQWFGFDIFRTRFLQSLILPRHLSSLIGNLTFTFGSFTIYATMYNTNFVGSFAAMMVPMALVIYLQADEQKHQVYSGIFLGMMIFVWFGSNSRAGMLGVVAGIALLLLMMHRTLKPEAKRWVIALGLILTINLMMNLISGGITSEQIRNLNPLQEGELQEDIAPRARFTDIRLDGNKLYIETDCESLVVHFATTELLFENLQGEVIESQFNGNVISFTDPAYAGWRFILQGDSGLLQMQAYGQVMDIFITNEGLLLSGVGGVSNQIDRPPYFSPLENHLAFASSRGYIWSRSIPMLRDTFFLGHGPDMYVIHFPQRDFVGRLHGFTLTGINDKPHNMYLQIGINTGVISLLSLMSVYGFYLIDSLRRYFRRSYDSYLDFIGVGVFASISGYLVSGIFNDQIVSVAPIFYVLTGLGLAINFILKSMDS